VLIVAPFHVSITPSGDVRDPYGASPAFEIPIEAARVIAEFVMSRPPVVVREAPDTLPVALTDPADTAPDVVTDPPDISPVAETDPADTNPVADTVAVLTSPTATGVPIVVMAAVWIADPLVSIPPVTNNDPPDMVLVAVIVEAFRSGFPLKSTPDGFVTGYSLHAAMSWTSPARARSSPS
jgi:hypothetical protein